MDELRSRVEKAETASEEYQRQLKMLQKKLDESMQEQGKLEEHVHESEAHINDLEDQKVHSIRHKREMEDLFESERTAMQQEKAEQKAKGEEQQAVIQRLKDTLAQREAKVATDEERALSRSGRLYAYDQEGVSLTTSSKPQKPVISNRPFRSSISS